MLAAHIAGAAAYCLVWIAFGVCLGWLLHRYPAVGPLWPAYLNWTLITMPFSVLMYFGVLGCVYAFSYFVQTQEREAYAERLTAQLAEARLGALRMQLNPHFLFNSLNALLVLVREQNIAGSVRMLELLSDVLHQVLSADQRQQVLFGDELKFLEQYFAIEQVRFSDRLRVNWNIDERSRLAYVPSFLLQPLVENAIKHGITKHADSGRIDNLDYRSKGPSYPLKRCQSWSDQYCAGEFPICGRDCAACVHHPDGTHGRARGSC